LEPGSGSRRPPIQVPILRLLCHQIGGGVLTLGSIRLALALTGQLAQARIETRLRAATALLEARFGGPGLDCSLLGEHLV
jgi:hypothetical protein